MDHAPTTLLFFFVACYCSSNEYFVAGGVASGSEQPLENQMSTMVNDSNSASLSSVQPRIVTDIHSGGHRLAEVSEDKNTNEVVSCNLLGEQTLIKLVLAAIPAAQVTNVSTEEMNQLVNTCMNIQPMTSGSSILDTLGDTLHSLVIFPGTKWCGAGDVAENDDDLGPAAATDRCCRDHDMSDDSIAPFETEHNVTNYRPYSMTDCADDRKFYNCLLNDSSATSVAVGTIFFDVLRTQCFEYGYPTKCTEYNLLLLLLLRPPCEEFEPDTSKPKEWHVVDDPSFLLGLLEKE
ncbi:phospholipase A2 hemilipin-like [Amblyomma americanum]